MFNLFIKRDPIDPGIPPSEFLQPTAEKCLSFNETISVLYFNYSMNIVVAVPDGVLLGVGPGETVVTVSTRNIQM